MRQEKTVLTYTSISYFKSCRRKYKYRYIDCLVPIRTKDNLFLGSMVHSFLEKHYTSPRRSPASLIKEVYQENATVSDDQIEAMAPLFESMMEAYCHHNMAEAFKVVTVEQEFSYHIDPETVLRGKVDGLIEKNGTTLLIEHKTTGAFNDNYIKRLSFDEQIILYQIFFQLTFSIPVQGVLYNVLKKSRLKIKKNETLEDYKARVKDQYLNESSDMFYRKIILFPPEILTSFETDFYQTIADIRFAIRSGHFYKNTSFCLNNFGVCPYFELCSSADNEAIRSLYYTKVEPHSELSPNDEGE